MATFIIKYRSKGKIQAAKLTAENMETARRLSTRFGAVLSIKRDQEFGRKVKGMTSADRFTFLTRLSTMLASRMATADALRLLRDSFQGPISNASSRLLDRLNVGTDLPSAIAEEKLHFPGSLGLIVKVSAKSGHIYTALKEAADFEQRMGQLKTSKGRTIAASVFGFIFAAALVVGSVFWIGPMVMSMGLIADNKDKIDIEWVNVMAEWIAIFIGVAGLLMGGLLWLGTIGRTWFPEWADKIIMKIPYYKDLVMAQDNYLVLRRLSLMIGTGVRVEDALGSALESAKPGMLKKNIKDALNNLRLGKKWSEAFSTLHPTDRAALALAADRVQIAENLNLIANQAQEIYISRLESFVPVLQIASALAMTLAGVVLFGQTMLPTLQLAAKMLG